MAVTNGTHATHQTTKHNRKREDDNGTERMRTRLKTTD